jgi:hypothetical protein
MQYRRPLMRPAINMLQRLWTLLLFSSILFRVLNLFQKAVKFDFFLPGARIVLVTVMKAAAAAIAVSIAARIITCEDGIA